MASVDDLRIDAPPARPRHRGPSPTPWLLLLGLVVFVWWMLGHPLPHNLSQLSLPGLPSAVTAPASPPATASGAPAESLASFAPAPGGSFSAGGYIEVIPPGPRAVAPLFAGKVVRLHVAAGDRVRRGQLLAELDSALLRQQAAVLQSRVDLAASQLRLRQAGFRSEEVLDAQAGVDRAQARLDRAQADAARAAELFQAGVMPRADYDAAQSELGQGQAELASARSLLALRRSGTRTEEVGIAASELKVAQAELHQVQFSIGQCRLTAPAEGVVYELLVPEGGWVDPADGGTTHAAVLTLFDPQALQAYADVNQRDSARLSVGQPVELTADAAPQAPFAGVVERLLPQANLQKNTVRAIIRLPAPPVYLKPEMNVKVSFLAAVGADGVRPQSGTQEEGQPPAAPTAGGKP